MCAHKQVFLRDLSHALCSQLFCSTDSPLLETHSTFHRNSSFFVLNSHQFIMLTKLRYKGTTTIVLVSGSVASTTDSHSRTPSLTGKVCEPMSVEHPMGVHEEGERRQSFLSSQEVT